MGSRYFLDFVDLARCAVKMCEHDHLDIRVNLKCFFQRRRIHIPCVALGINKNRDAALVNHRVHRGGERNIRTEDPLIAQRAFSDFRLSIHGFPGELHGKMERRRSCRQCDCISDTDSFGDQSLNFVDILSYRGHPVCLIRFGNVLQFLAVHGRRRQPNFFLKRFQLHNLHFPFQ